LASCWTAFTGTCGRAPDAGPALACGRRVPDLGYADNFCLLASTAAYVKRLLDVAHTYFTAIGMAVSTAKTRVMVFATGPAAGAPGPVWTCGGAPLGRVGEYKYLGVVFSAEQGLAAGFLTAPARQLGTFAAAVCGAG